jgi:hypothetical protein
MKKAFTFFAWLVFIANTTFTQEVQSPQKGTKDSYLKKSKQQKTAAFVLLGVGAVCLGVAAEGNIAFDALPILVIGGGAAAISSIPLFIASGKNKRRALNMSAGFKLENLPRIRTAGVSQTYYPAVSIQLGL